MSFLSPLAAPDPADRMSADQLVEFLRAAGEPTRLRILVLLEKGDLTVKDLTEILGQSQPRISRHLKLLTEAGLVDRFPEGAWVYYRLADNAATVTLASVIRSLIDARDARLARDRERLDQVKRARSERAAAYFARNAHAWDEIRSLQVEDSVVETAIQEAIGTTPFDAYLDLGTGTGRLIELLDGRWARALGIDLSHDMLAVARAHLDRAGVTGAQVRLGDIYALDLPRDSFDLVSLHQVLHYLEDPARAIREAARVLRPGGRIVVVDFAPHDLEFLREEHAHRRLGFSHGEITRLLEQAGLAVETIRDLPAPGPGQLTVTLWLARDPRLLVAHDLKRREAVA
ncbi:ArsR/SmtB family transcription factor [Prosthecomicrobium hirschii]|uniref:ArsR family transcriptional regulator n=1 Tax=Prosthecodimorpha hirschii TaxID=665126 RepID=A0A0N8GEJ4_9HYPH|nr:metalloregulator ArsR/SmtB family transcription factor [Prosthecomicrobium hirschii]KPL51689.1 ArsR family transcriptional regulator [Prosthecomicrobium hirschii]MCW1844015.1 metalloregulator ArsR/SmtB family transcription factor [Prosthecomicrobium hirschii]TPQ49214.1 methyltransferase domain-containing protein [Prosthecomicrobium hirschii]